jgi:hypothetical protein
MQHKFHGNSKLDRCAKIYAEMDEFYKRTGADSRLPKLLPTMLRAEQNGKVKTPKLRCKAGESKCLVPWCLEMAVRHLDPASSVEATMIDACRRLNDMYSCLRTASWDSDCFEKASREFLLLFAALQEHFAADQPGRKLFRLKPKAHMLMELALCKANPSQQWTYRDEAFGHSLALLAKRRGGKFSVRGVSRSVVLRFLAANPVPRFE